MRRSVEGTEVREEEVCFICEGAPIASSGLSWRPETAMAARVPSPHQPCADRM